MSDFLESWSRPWHALQRQLAASVVQHAAPSVPQSRIAERTEEDGSPWLLRVHWTWLRPESGATDP